MAHLNLQLLELSAEALRPLLSEIVFVGGCVTALHITDPAAAPVRVTHDVDVISEITSYGEYMTFSERLRGLGFKEDAGEGAPLCRWRRGALIVDVMPLDEKILGFSNRWYADAFRSASVIQLKSGVSLKVASAAHLLATKLEAFRGRGNGDYFASHDLEDLIAVIDGRESIVDEVAAATAALRDFIAEGIKSLITDPLFIDALPGFLLPDEASQGRLTLLLDRLRALARL
jgi:predicted nucleotidyltransferase